MTSQINVKQVNIGNVSKGVSCLFLSGSRFSGIKKTGLVDYVKKQVYGPAEITAKALEFCSTKKKAIAQKENIMSMNGKLISPVFLNPKKLYAFEGMP
tara:strand:+ start:628 stop:921 length:294 start_codon:yes stop_codon:yes gene_type:complete